MEKAQLSNHNPLKKTPKKTLHMIPKMPLSNSNLLLLAGSLLTISCGQHPTLLLKLKTDIRTNEMLQELHIDIRDIHMQPRGFDLTTDHQITPEWIPIPPLHNRIDAFDAQKTAITIAHFQPPQDQYQRLFIRASRITGINRHGETLELENVLEPIGMELQIDEKQRQEITLTLIVLAGIKNPKRLSLYAKDIEVD